MIIEELKHMEIKDTPTDDGGMIEHLVINTVFPPINNIVLKITNTSLYLEFPHFSLDLTGDFRDKQG